MADPFALAEIRRLEKQGGASPEYAGQTAALAPYPYGPGTFGGSVAGRPIGPYLPRPYDTYMSGAFGPFAPILPMPIDMPEPGGEGRAGPRRWQYPVGWNIPIGLPGTEGLTLVTFQMLRTLAMRFSTLWGMLNLRVKELVGLDWDVGSTKDAQQAAKSDKGLARDQSARAKQMVDWFRWHIDPNYTDGFQSWFTAALWDQFIMDAVAVHPLPTRVPGKGLFGRGLAHWELLDGSIVRPLIDIHGALPLPPAPAYQIYIWGVPRTDLLQVLALDNVEEIEAIMSAADMPINLDDLEPDGVYRADQLHYWRQTPWTNNVYGMPPVAAALLPIAIGLQRQQWFADFYAEGTVPSVFVVAGPSYNTATQQLQLQNSLNALAGDVAWKHRIIVLPPDSKALPQKDLSFAKDVDLAIMEYLYPVLQIQPQEIGQMPGGRTSGLGGSKATESMQDTITKQRTQPDRKLWKQRFDRLIQQTFGQTDLEWKWVQFEQAEDELQKAQKEASQLANGQRTIDAIRTDNGEDPYGLPLTSSPFLKVGGGIIPLDPSVEVPPVVPVQGKPPAPGAPASAPGATDASGGSPEQPQEPGSDTQPEDAATSDAQTPPGEAPADDPVGKLTLADIVKWRIRYSGKKLPATIHGYLLRSYPEDEVTWAADERIDWRMEPHVKLDDINWTRRPGGRNYEKEQAIADSLAQGATMDPIVLCEFASKSVYNRAGLTVADGYHRTGGADKAGWTDVPAFVGRNVPDEYRGRIRGSMQDESASVQDQKKAALAELVVLRRYLKAGRDGRKFVPSALDPSTVAMVVGEAVLHSDPDTAFVDMAGRLTGVDTSGMTVEQAHKAAREGLAKDLSLTAPLPSGLVPFDLEGQSAPSASGTATGIALVPAARCGICGTPLPGNSDVPISEAAVGLCGDCQVAEVTGSRSPGQGEPFVETKAATPDLLALLDAELTARGIDIATLA